ncbi:DNA-3-methyladenine glycosylase I [Daejeonella oryzae]|uniref:DNA-3-methyladenine glycosylase I n=1 Tax=Daejeonella oryzae TaxID=1122943 RepID=UPI0003FFEE6E|nr:DNA-3-methyladenine glycosylase I [Daejeonella oryzae]
MTDTSNLNDPNITRCTWCGTDPLYVEYHDKEWGKPVYDDKILFEFLILESAQAGLSWITVLRKRENYRKAFVDFDAEKIANFSADDIERLMLDAGIIRNRQKIEAAINNAKLFLKIQEEYGSFSDYMWGFLPDKKPILNSWEQNSGLPARTELSDRISSDMKKKGFKFFGSTICYAHMQATGMVNDHITGCISR